MAKQRAKKQPAKKKKAAAKKVFTLEYFQQQGAKGGKKGALITAEKLGPKGRHERAKKAAAAREAKRKKNM